MALSEKEKVLIKLKVIIDNSPEHKVLTGYVRDAILVIETQAEELQQREKIIKQCEITVASSTKAIETGELLIELLQEELRLCKETVDRESTASESWHHDLIEIGIALDRIGVPRSKKDYLGNNVKMGSVERILSLEKRVESI